MFKPSAFEPKSITLSLNGVILTIDENRTITISGHENVVFKCDGKLVFDAESVGIHTKKEMYIGAERIINQAKEIHLNPLGADGENTHGYRKEVECLEHIETMMKGSVELKQ